MRLGLTDLEAGYAVEPAPRPRRRPAARDATRSATRAACRSSGSRSTTPRRCPARLPGRAIALGAASERSWLIRAPADAPRPLPRSSRCTSGPATRSASSRPPATVGQGVDRDRLPARRAAARVAAAGRQPRGQPRLARANAPDDAAAMSVRPYAPGDSMNRIQWKATARHGEIQVKEFDLEQTADALDLPGPRSAAIADRSRRRVHDRGRRARGRLVADKAIGENRAVGHHASTPRRTAVAAGGPRRTPAPEDHAAARGGRGRRQHAAGRDAGQRRSAGCAAG